jgi:(heptosyl)LPS beta-1,4-glucosyltransferase
MILLFRDKIKSVGKISIVINTLNEEKNLPRALASVKNLADEIVVCDMYSSDNTVAIAKKAGAKVCKYKKTGYVEPARNYAISKTTGDWVLILDADEKVGRILADKLKRISVDKNSADYYRLPRKNIIFGKWIKHSRWWPDYNIRFFKKGMVSWSEIIHSVPETQGKGLDLKAKEANAIIHYHYDSVEQFIGRLNRYTSVQSKELKKGGYEFDWRDLIRKPVGEFLARYFQGQGYKDGVHGLALAGLQAFSEFVKYLKTWKPGKVRSQSIAIGNVVEIMEKAESDFRYWQADTLLKEVGGAKYWLKRKLKLP